MRVQVKIVDGINKQRYLISRQKELIDYYETMSYSLGGIDYSKEPIDCTKNNDAPFVKWIYKKIEAEEVLKQLEKELEQMLGNFSIELESLENPDHRRILSYRYVLNKSWDEIPEIMHYSKSNVYKLHREALILLEKSIVQNS